MEKLRRRLWLNVRGVAIKKTEAAVTTTGDHHQVCFYSVAILLCRLYIAILLFTGNNRNRVKFSCILVDEIRFANCRSRAWRVDR